MLAVPLGSIVVDSPPARRSPELAYYVRHEYGDESPEWLVLEAQKALLNGSFDQPRWAGLKGALGLRDSSTSGQ